MRMDIYIYFKVLADHHVINQVYNRSRLYKIIYCMEQLLLAIIKHVSCTRKQISMNSSLELFSTEMHSKTELLSSPLVVDFLSCVLCGHVMFTKLHHYFEMAGCTYTSLKFFIFVCIQHMLFAGLQKLPYFGQCKQTRIK